MTGHDGSACLCWLDVSRLETAELYTELEVIALQEPTIHR
jgi:hypothetical protein